MKKHVKFRHKFFFAVLRPVAWLVARKLHFKTKPQKVKKGNYLILSNHQSYLDPMFVALTIRRPIYFVATDALYSQKWYLKLLFYCFGPIKKRKGAADFVCIHTMCKIAKEGGTVAVFPEGNRQWNDSVFHIDRATVKLIRLIKRPVILYNFHGGYGVQPRWGKGVRKGRHYGEIKEILPWEKICKMSDDELYEKVISALKVIDSDSGEKYKSKERAEYLERQLFICPKCGAQSTLRSQGASIKCSNCGLDVTYGENLRLSSPDPEFAFEKIVDWYEFQQKYVREYDLSSTDVLCSDENVKLYDKTERKRVLVADGKITLTNGALSVGEWSIATSQIFGGCAQDGDKLSFNVGDRSYIVKGHERFNSIKYLLFFNRVCKLIEEKGGDKYYGLYLDPDKR